MRNLTIRKALAATATLSLAMGLGGCVGGVASNTSLESIHQPVVTRTNFTLDLNSGPGGLSLPEQRRLAGWFTETFPGGQAMDEDGPSTEALREGLLAINGIGRGTADQPTNVVAESWMHLEITPPYEGAFRYCSRRTRVALPRGRTPLEKPLLAFDCEPDSDRSREWT